ncbi:MAG: C-terminal binding protein [Halanaeroarchaeum sp.]
MATPRVVVFDDRIPDLDIEAATFGDLDVDLRLSGGTSEAHVAEDGADATGIIVDANVPVPGSAIASMDNLEIVARSGIGFDNVDLEAAREHDVRVTNVPDYCIEEVSTHALGLILTLGRKLHVYDRETSEGRWEWADGVPIERLSEKTLGIVGHGNIGSRAAAKAEPFFGRRLAYDPYVTDSSLRDAGVEPASFEVLLSEADVVSVHPPLTAETEHMFDASAFDRMSRGTVLVNTSRGGVVDQEALATALDDGTVAAAGLDVLEREPPVDDPLLERDDVVATPHAGWYSEDAMEELRRAAAEEVKRAIEGRPAINPVDEHEWA